MIKFQKKTIEELGSKVSFFQTQIATVEKESKEIAQQAHFVQQACCFSFVFLAKPTYHHELTFLIANELKQNYELLELFSKEKNEKLSGLIGKVSQLESSLQEKEEASLKIREELSKAQTLNTRLTEDLSLLKESEGKMEKDYQAIKEEKEQLEKEVSRLHDLVETCRGINIDLDKKFDDLESEKKKLQEVLVTHFLFSLLKTSLNFNIHTAF